MMPDVHSFWLILSLTAEWCLASPPPRSYVCFWITWTLGFGYGRWSDVWADVFTLLTEAEDQLIHTYDSGQVWKKVLWQMVAW